MNTPKSEFIRELKQNSIESILVSIKRVNYLNFESIKAIIIRSTKEIKTKNLKSLLELHESIHTTTNSLAEQFYTDCKKELYSDLVKSKTKFDNQNLVQFLDKLFSYIETSYLTPFHQLQFLRNNLGFINSSTFLRGTDISISSKTQGYIESRSELLQKIVNCYQYYEF